MIGMTTATQRYSISRRSRSLAEVLDLAREGRIQSRVQTYELQRINDALSDLRTGKVDGRAVITP